MADIGFVGLGIMGHAMAGNLVRAGFDTVVWNRTPSKASDLVEMGAALAPTPVEPHGRARHETTLRRSGDP